MDPGPLLTAVVWIGSGLLIYAGAIKFPVPDGAMAGLHSLGLPSGRVAARLLGAAEILTGLTVIIIGGTIAAAASAMTYLALTAIAARQRAKQVDCGCFGVKTYPVSRLHIGLNATMALASVAGLLAPLSALGDVASDVGTLGILAAAVTIAAAVGLVTTLTERAGLAESVNLVRAR